MGRIGVELGHHRRVGRSAAQTGQRLAAGRHVDQRLILRLVRQHIVDRQHRMGDAHLADDRGAGGLARLVGQGEIQGLLAQLLVLRLAEQRVERALLQVALRALGHHAQLVPGRLVGILGDDAQPDIAQRPVERGRVGRQRGEAAVGLGHHALVAHAAQRRDQAGAQHRHLRPFAGLGIIADGRQRRGQLGRGIGRDLRLGGGVALQHVIAALQIAGHFGQHGRAAIDRHRVDQVERQADRLVSAQRQLEIVRHQAGLVHAGQLAEALGQCLDIGGRIERAIIAGLARIDDIGAAARQRDLAIALQDQALRLAALHLRLHRHIPLERRLVLGVAAKLALAQRQDGVATLALGALHLDQRDARLAGEIMRNADQALGTRALDRLPKIVGDGVPIGVALHIGLDARLPRILAGIAFEHGDDRFALLIGDGVKRLVHLIDGGDLLHDRVGGLERVEAHRPLAAIDARQQRFPFRVQLVSDLGRHPARKTFVQPEIVPPGHGDEIAEPLVRHFMRGHFIDGALGLFRGEARIDQQGTFEGEDRAPILHRAEELALARTRDIVELGQREGHAEIVVIIGQDRRRRVERQLRLAGIAPAGDDADFGIARHLGRAVQFAQAEEKQVGGHFGAGAEGHQLLAAANVLARLDRHVADRQLVRRDHGAEVKGRLVARLVEARHETAGVGCLELGEERALRGAFIVGIVEREQAVRLLVDDAGIDHGQLVAARLHRLAEVEADGLGIGIDLRRTGDRLALGRGQRDAGDGQVGRVEHQSRHGRGDSDVDRHLAGEFEVRRIGRHFDRIMARRGATGQLGGDTGGGAGRRGLGQRGRGDRQRRGRHQERQDFRQGHGGRNSDTAWMAQ